VLVTRTSALLDEAAGLVAMQTSAEVPLGWNPVSKEGLLNIDAVDSHPGPLEIS
jgi:hypothetical protein